MVIADLRSRITLEILAREATTYQRMKHYTTTRHQTLIIHKTKVSPVSLPRSSSYPHSPLPQQYLQICGLLIHDAYYCTLNSLMNWINPVSAPPPESPTRTPTPNAVELLSKYRTFRLSSIPIGVQRQQLWESLEALYPGTDKNVNVKVLCLAPKGCRWQVGTATFIREPPEFKRCLPNCRQELSINIAGAEVELAIDVDFYGMVLAPLIFLHASNLLPSRRLFIVIRSRKL